MLSRAPAPSILAAIHHAAHNHLNCCQFALFTLLLIVFFGYEKLTAGYTPNRETVIEQYSTYPRGENSLFGWLLTELFLYCTEMHQNSGHLQHMGFNLCPLTEGQSSNMNKKMVSL